MTKYTALIELHRMGGVIPSSEWTTGTGKHIKLRAIPPYCRKIDVSEIDTLSGIIRQTAKRMTRKRPLIRYLIVIVDLRQCHRIIKQESGV